MRAYYLNADESWTYRPFASWKKDNVSWWLGDTSGWYAKNSTQVINDVSYAFNARGYWIEG